MNRFHPVTGFTLVEILVVIAILALLAALLFGALARSQEKGRSAVCQSNLRQIGLATQLYADDHAGFFPPVSDGKISGIQFWPTNIRPYLGDAQVLQCPTLAAKFGTGFSGEHYLYNTLRLNFSPSPAQMKAGIGWLPRHESSVADAARTWTVSETNEPSESQSTSNCGRTSFWPTHHRGGSNAVFVDGHVKWLNPESACALERALPRLDLFAP